MTQEVHIDPPPIMPVDAAHGTLGAAIVDSRYLRRLVRQDEQAVLRHADHDDGLQHPCARPFGQASASGGSQPEGLRDRHP